MKNSATVLMLLFFIVFAACKKETATQNPVIPVETLCSKFSLEGIWTRTEGGTNGDPACLGEKIEYKNGTGTGIIIYEPAGCRFIAGDVKWSNLRLSKCTILNTYLTDPILNSVEPRIGGITFINADKVTIHGVTYTK